MKKRNLSDIIFNVFNYTFMIVIVIITVFPIWHVVVASFSSPNAVSTGRVSLLPMEFNFNAYKSILSDKNIWIGYGNTVFYSFVGTALSMALTMLGGYSLSKTRLRGRKFLMIMVTVTMWFGAGTMPTFLNYKELGLLDKRLGLLLCGAISSFNVILMRTYFESIPNEIEESAKIDGASDFCTFWKIYTPLSMAALLTITLYYFVGRWNSYLWASILLKDESKIPLQVILQKYVVEMNQVLENGANIDYTTTSRETFTYAIMVIATLPMIVIYPFIQKFFVKGVMVGAVKG